MYCPIRAKYPFSSKKLSFFTIFTKTHKLKKSLLLFLMLGLVNLVYSQAPQSIPYQAVARDALGNPMANQSLTVQFSLHEASADGAVVFQETQSTTTNGQGLFSLTFGAGVPSVGTFSNINWVSGYKFLQVQADFGNGYVDLGTQQLMSVPYTLFSNQIPIEVSTFGDTLLIGNNKIIVPGISSSNQNNTGAFLLPQNPNCANQNISVSGCNGINSIEYNQKLYQLVEIGGQCWFAENLATDKFKNNEFINTTNDSAIWANSNSAMYTEYNNDLAIQNIYGNLYNWYSATDSRGVCPNGWHIPNDCEWMYMENFLGMSVTDQNNISLTRGNNEGGMIKSLDTFISPNIGATNNFGFSAIAGGVCVAPPNNFTSLNRSCFFWTTSDITPESGIVRSLNYNYSTIGRVGATKQRGYSLRCVKD